MQKFLKDKKKIALAIVALILIGYFLVSAVSSSNSNKKYEVFEVKKAKLDQAIIATGSLQPATALDMSFQKSAQVREVLADVGDRVKKGEILATLENGKESASLAQSKASLAEAQANLNLKLASAPKEDIDMARSDIKQALANQGKVQVDVANSELDFKNTKLSVAQDISTAELDLENARLNLEKVSVLSSNSTQQSDTDLENAKRTYLSSLGQFLVATKSALQTVNKVYGVDGTASTFEDYMNVFAAVESEFQKGKNFYTLASTRFNDLKTRYNQLSQLSTLADIQSTGSSIQILSDSMNELLLATSSILDKVITTIDVSADTVIKLRSDVSTAGTSFNSSLSSFNAAKKNLDDAILNGDNIDVTAPVDLKTAEILVTQKQQNLKKIQVNGDIQISNKKAALDSSRAQLEVQKALTEKSRTALEKILAAPRNVDIAPFQARVAQVSAQVLSAQNDFDDTLLKAPFDGIVTAKNIETGEQSTASASASGKAAMSMIDDSQFHIDVNIPETQVNRVTDDSKVTVTFDAVEGEIFEGKILSVEPAATNVQSTIYYKAKIALVKNDPRLKTDMTADVTINSTQPKTALLIPEKAIILAETQKTVQISLDPSGKDTSLQNSKSVFIETGTRDKNGFIEVTAGLKQGDKILVPAL